MRNFLHKTTGVFRHPGWIIALTVAATIGLGFALPRISFDNSAKAMLPKENRDVDINDYYSSSDRFGNSDYLIVAFERAEGVDLTTIRTVQAVEQEIKTLAAQLPAQNLAKAGGTTLERGTLMLTKVREQGISRDTFATTFLPKLTDPSLWTSWGAKATEAERWAGWTKSTKPSLVWDSLQNPISKTQSILTAETIENRDGELLSQKIFEKPDVTEADVPEILRRATAWNLFEDLLISRDRTTTALLIKLAVTSADATDGTSALVEQVLARHQTPGIQTSYTGEYRFNQKMGEYMQEDLGFLLPFVTLVLAGMLFLIFRKWQAVVLSLSVVLVGVVTSLGLMAWFGVQLTIVGIATPVLLVAIACAYTVHQLNHYYLEPVGGRREVLVKNMRTVGLALVLSGIATSVGFGALVVDDFVPMRNFGLFTALGNLFALGAALYFLPALLLAGKSDVRPTLPTQKTWIDGILEFLVRLQERFPRRVIVVSALLTLVLLAGLPLVVSQLNPLAFFQKSDPLVTATQRINAKLGGNQTLNLVIDSDLRPLQDRQALEDPRDILTPQVLQKLDEVSQAALQKFPHLVGKTVSFVDLIKKMNQEMHDGDPAFYTIPTDPRLISQYMLLFSGEITDYVTSAHDKLNVTLSLKDPSTPQSEAVRQFLLSSFSPEWLQSQGVHVEVTGTAHLYSVSNELLVEGTLISIGVCLAVVIVLLLFVLKSVRLSLIAATPILFTLVMNFGLMGWSGVVLDAGTSLVASVAIGIGVDFAIHFITWYQHELAKDGDRSRALADTIRHKGRAILYNMITIQVGFGILALSRFVPLINFGLLTALSMLATAMGALILVPALIRVTPPKPSSPSADGRVGAELP